MSIMPVVHVRILVERSRFLRFMLSGGINTITTYAVYLILLRIVDYKLAYTVAYIGGIALSYLLNRVFVFRTHRGWSSALLFPLVYLAQYLVGLAAIWAWVNRFGFPKPLAPLIAIVITVPMTYFLSKLVFMRHAS